MDDVPSFGAWVRQRRLRLGLTQADVGRATGYAGETIRKIEADARRPSPELAERLTDCLQIAEAERSAFLRFARGESATIQPAPLPLQAVPGPEPPPAEGHRLPAAPPQPAGGPRHGRLPPPPRLLIGREQDLHQLKAHLLPNPSQAVAPVQVLTAVRGWPGVGKTTIATAVAHDPEIGTAFPDGVLWASLGPTPNLFAEVLAWAQALGAGDLAQVPDLEAVTSALTALLATKHMLLVVDDVWNAEHALPFRVGGPHCALLITTRLPHVAHALASTPDHIYNLPVLGEPQALELLETLAPSVVARHPQACHELVRDLEGLPLAIHVAGGLLNTEAAYGLEVQDLLADLRDGVNLLARQAPVEYADVTRETTPTVAVLFQKSTDRLDPAMRDCFALLGAFAPKPATFDLAALQAVWGVADPKPIVRDLVDRGLLEPVGHGRFQLHALLVSHARALLTP